MWAGKCLLQPRVSASLLAKNHATSKPSIGISRGTLRLQCGSFFVEELHNGEVRDAP